jgi:hypothetical protein
MFLLNKNTIRNSRFSNWLVDFCNKNIVAKTIVVFLIWAVALIPVYLFLIARWGIGPEGFWQELALVVVAAVVIGWLQAIFIFLAIALSLVVICEDI